MAERSKRIELLDDNKIDKINKETMKFYKKYEIDMGLRELSEKTIYGYKTDLFGWFIYVLENQGNQCITDLDEDDITEFLYFCKKQGNNSRRLKRRMSAISAFYKYLRKKRLVKENPMEYIDRAKKDTDVVVQTFLSQEQVDLMKQKLVEHGDLQLQIYGLLSLSTMARVNAVSNITWKQIDFASRVVNDVLEKEGKIVTLYFSKEVAELLLKLKEKREKDGVTCDYVFVTNYGGEIQQVSVSTLSSWCKKIGDMIDVPSFHPHDFRHSGSNLLKQQGCPLETISDLLNHESTETTRKHYLTQDKKKMQSEKDKYNI